MRWDTDVDAQNLNIRYACEVTEVSGVKGDFEVRLANGGSIYCRRGNRCGGYSG